MGSLRSIFICVVLAVLLSAPVPGLPAEAPASPETMEKPSMAVSENMGGAAKREAAEVRKKFEEQARSLFEREPLGWDLQTVRHLYRKALSLPLQLPELTRQLVEHSRGLGVFGSILVLLFAVVAVYSLFGQRRVFTWVEKKAQPLAERIPEGYYPYFLSVLRVVVAALIPLVLLAVFSLINAMITYRAAWFRLTGRLLGLWAVSALIICSLREVLTRGLFEATATYGKPIFRRARLVVLYALIGIAVFWPAEIFAVP